MSAREEQVRSLMCEEAADWFLAHREGLDVARREQFASWLQASPQHVEEYLGIALTARDLRRALAGAAIEQTRAVHGRDSRGLMPERRWRYALAAAAGIVLALGLWMYQRIAPPPPPAPIQLATRHGEQLSERLADGSVLHLNTDTAVSVDFQQHARRIDLKTGQAMFEVAHDRRRPFTVYAQSLAVTAVGTMFDVYQRTDSVVISVIAGTVTVAPVEAAGAGATSRRPPAMLVAGEQLRVGPGEWPGVRRSVDPQRATAWLRREISFAHEPLGELAVEFTRYASSPIVIEGSALRSLPVSGTFAADDTAAFIAFLRSLDGVQVEVGPTRTRVWHK